MPQVYIKIPTGLTFAKIKSGVNLDGLNAYFTSVGAPTLSVGDDNPFWQYVLELGVTGNIERSDDPLSMAVFGPIGRTGFIDFGPIGLSLLAGGEVTGLPVWFEVANANLNDEVPIGLPGSTYVDEENVEHTHTWSTYPDSNHPPQEYAGKTYIGGNARVGRELDASEWHPIYANPPLGVRVISSQEFQAIQLENQEII